MEELGYPNSWPGWFQPPPCETKKGLGHIVKAMYLSLVLMLMSLLILGILVVGLSDISTEESALSSLGVLAVVGILSLVLLVVGLVAFVLFLMGLSEMNRGRREFGEAHAKKVQQAIIFLVLAIIITVAGSVISAMFLFSGMNDMANMNTPDADSLFTSALLGGIFSMIGSVLSNLFMVYLVLELSDQKHRSYLWTGFGVGIATGALGLAFQLYFISDFNTGTSMDVQSSMWSTYLSVGMYLFSFIIYLICYRAALARFDSGELKPALPQMPGWGPMPQPAYPGYWPPPPPGAQPMAPPPVQQPTVPPPPQAPKSPDRENAI